MICTVAKHHKHAHHKHAHHKQDEPKSKLRKLAVPITLIVILIYAAQWAVRFPRTAPINLAAGIAIAAAAASFWILYPRKDR
jgi:MFS superfamily sulfate permease-like transporter